MSIGHPVFVMVSWITMVKAAFARCRSWGASFLFVNMDVIFLRLFGYPDPQQIFINDFSIHDDSCWILIFLKASSQGLCMLARERWGQGKQQLLMGHGYAPIPSPQLLIPGFWTCPNMRLVCFSSYWARTWTAQSVMGDPSPLTIKY